MADNRATARKYARRYFGPKGQALFMAQMGQEAGFKTGRTSSAGAQGPAQLMPGTAAAWGVKNPNDPDEAYRAAASHMAQYLKAYGGSWDKALTAYNAGPGRVGGPLPAETRNYIKTIRANAGQYAPGTGPQSGSSGPSGPTTVSTKVPTLDLEGYKAARGKALVGQMIARRNPHSFLLRSGLLGDQPGQMPSLADFMGSRTVTTRTGGARRRGTSGRVDSRSGTFKITGPNPGRLQPGLKRFARQVSSVLGEPITGSDGTGHSYLTVNGNVSEHSSGDATDVPARGKRLIRYGQAALIAAGMPEAQARKQTGGLFNVGNHQIIFNTHEGGDHTDHLHISTHRRRK